MTDEEHDAIIAGLRRRSQLAVRAYWLLHETAAAGGVCPTNRRMGEALKYPGNESNLSAVMKTLVNNGLVTLVTGKVYRQVTIVQTGKSTRPIPDGGALVRKREMPARAEGWAGEDRDLAGNEKPVAWIRRVRGIIDQKLAEGGRI